jgi:TolA-binding protein
MKNFLLIIMFLVSFVGFSQTNNKPQVIKTDTTKICFPVEVGRQILIDLNECDKNKELLKLSNLQIGELENKVIQKDNIIQSLEQKDSLNSVIVIKTEEKFNIVNDENLKLRKEIKTIKTKRTIIEGVLGLFSGVLVYIIATK